MKSKMARRACWRLEKQSLLMHIVVGDWPGLETLRGKVHQNLPAVTALKVVRTRSYRLKRPETGLSMG